MPEAAADTFRIEPLWDEELATGLAMEIADPAWMLSRQWLLGELSGQDAGSPGVAHVWVETMPFAHFGALAVPAGTPLEPHIENEWQPRDGEAAAHLAVLAGRQFRRELEAEIPNLDAAGRTTLETHWQNLLSSSRIAQPAGPLAAFAASVPDGTALFSLYSPLWPNLPSNLLPATGSDQTAARLNAAYAAAVGRFVNWYVTATGRALAEGGAWSASRLEYQGSLRAGNLVLSLSEYDSGRLDWYSFDVSPASGGFSTYADAAPRIFVPAPASFRGMPARRVWELEDSAVDLGRLRVEPEDVAAMLVIEFALRYGNDFFVVPLKLPAGIAAWIGALVVTDTFGNSTLINAASEQDDGLRVFGQPFQNLASMLVFPVAADGPESDPVEDVVLARDEGANLCWAIEKLAPDPLSGLPADRTPDAAALAPPEPPAPASGALVYQYRSRVAENWYPLQPPSGSPAALGLGAQAAPSSRVLRELHGVALPAEEVTRNGHRIVRTWRFTRAADGTPRLWVGRRGGPAPETGSSGLRFDILTGP
jgi:hypothetical protein